MNDPRAPEIFRRLQAASTVWPNTSLSAFSGQPFEALIAAMLSAQTREEQTTAAANALFAAAHTPADVLALGEAQVRALIRPVSYPEAKARYTIGICERLLAVDGGVVPRGLDALTAYPGVGHKVATLVQWVAYGIDDHVCVDVHVARIGVRLALVDASVKATPKIDAALREALPREAWGPWNALNVMFGRAICQARSPQCPRCPLNDLCPKIGVGPR